MSLAQGSPRLPSPPPPAEIQLGPKSPALGSTASRQAQQMEQTIADANSKRRIHPGTKSEDMAAGPPLVPLSELDSAFQLQEHLSALHYHHTASNKAPITREIALQLATPPPGIDRILWLYELCRVLIAQCNSLIVGFLFDTPPCSSETCPEMRASEWQFLCAVHDQPKSCCAIDYCCHTLDWAANVVTNPKIFPSRFVVMSDGQDRSTGQKNLINVFRRLHRILAHAWFQHRGVFWSIEAQTGLYVFFKTVCDVYDLLPAENYKLPPEAEGLEPTPLDLEDKKLIVTAIAKPPSQQHESTDNDSLHARRSNTARHSSRPSTGSAVTTVIEEREDEQDVANKLKALHISAPETVEEESEVEVPVIVEGDLMGNSPSAPEAPEAPAAPVLAPEFQFPKPQVDEEPQDPHENPEGQESHEPHVLQEQEQEQQGDAQPTCKITIEEDVSVPPEAAAETKTEPAEDNKEASPPEQEQVTEEKSDEPTSSTEEQVETTEEVAKQPDSSAPEDEDIFDTQSAKEAYKGFETEEGAASSSSNLDAD